MVAWMLATTEVEMASSGPDAAVEALASGDLNCSVSSSWRASWRPA
jgi:hypothetical protein